MKKYKLGKCQKTGLEGARVWIENRKAAEYGFVPGSVFVCEEANGKFLIKLCLLEDDDIVWGEPHTVSSKGDKSVIDLTGYWVKDIFDGYSHYSVSYEQGVIKLGGANE